MYTLGALLLTIATACAIARPPGPYTSTVVSQDGPPRDLSIPVESPSRRYLRDYLLPRYLWPHYFGYEESPRVPYPQPQMPATDWLNKEIERINGMEEGIAVPYRTDLARPITYNTNMKRYFSTVHDTLRQPFYERLQIPSQPMRVEPMFLHEEQHKMTTEPPNTKPISNEDRKMLFALTPMDKGYFDRSENDNTLYNMPAEGIHEGGGRTVIEIEPRQIRQNPNLSRKKTLVAENLDKLRSGLYNKDYRLPVSLLPSNLRWLKVNRPNEVDESGQEDRATDKPGHIHVLESATPDPAGSIYGVALIAAVGAAIAMAVLGMSVGWYTLTKRAKAAADVDYPAYGVTGPTIDTSGDRKLAQSAHMYHYQHQKQQIIAMERNGMATHNGSVSDPDSEEENEEGHYTVYECPGFATTGDMEVKNPLFNEEPTPATPGKCEVVKPQPKE